MAYSVLFCIATDHLKTKSNKNKKPIYNIKNFTLCILRATTFVKYCTVSATQRNADEEGKFRNCKFSTV
jgi:hypothetical protein